MQPTVTPVRKPYKDYRQRKLEKRAARRKAYMVKYYKRNYSKFYAAAAKRRAVKLNATPTWLSPADVAEIEGIYQFAQIMSLIGGRPYEVDHIEPLQGKTVCGLHVPWNLQVLERSENRQKSNSLT